MPYTYVVGVDVIELVAVVLSVSEGVEDRVGEIVCDAVLVPVELFVLDFVAVDVGESVRVAVCVCV